MGGRHQIGQLAAGATLFATLCAHSALAQTIGHGSLADAVAGSDLPTASRSALAAEPANPPVDEPVDSPVESLSQNRGEGALSGRPQTVGDDFYCQRRGLGTWFYCDHPKAAEQSSASQPQPSATDQVEALRKQGDELRNRAILKPTEANVIAYMKYLREQTDMASTLADMWGRVLIAHPELDYTLQRPVSNLGKANWQEQRQSDIEATMRALNDRYGVFYFYDTRSKASQIESPIMRSLADNYGLAVVAVSQDGGASADFPEYVVDHGERERMGLPDKVTPAVALFDTVTKKAILIASGITAADDIMQRIFILTKTKPGEDF